MTHIKELLPHDIYPIRHEVLRKGKPFETSFFEGDKLKSTKHFGLFVANELAGVVSLFQNNNPNFTFEKQFQLRGMAVLNQHQNKGFGKLLIEKAEDFAKSINIHFIWFNARENAVPFYQKSNYSIFGNPFNIKEIGLHFVMFKKLE